MNKRREFIQQLKEKRLTYQEIGDILGISRQRVHQILLSENPRIRNPIRKKFTKEEVAQILLQRAKENEKNNSIEQFREALEIKKMGTGGRDKVREMVRMRDNYTCQWCGRKWVEGERRFDVHHINGTSKDTRKVDRNFLNQITLCHKCHLQIDGWKMVRKSS